MAEENEYVCEECLKRMDEPHIVRKCFDCGCLYCHHNVPQLNEEVTPRCPKCGSEHVSF